MTLCIIHLYDLLNVCVSIVEAVREVVCSRLLPSWLLRLDGDIIELLHRLDVENCSQTALDTLKAIFKGTPTDELLQNRVQLDNRCSYLSGSHMCETVNEIPEIKDVCVFQQEADPSRVSEM